MANWQNIEEIVGEEKGESLAELNGKMVAGECNSQHTSKSHQ